METVREDDDEEGPSISTVEEDEEGPLPDSSRQISPVDDGEEGPLSDSGRQISPVDDDEEGPLPDSSRQRSPVDDDEEGPLSDSGQQILPVKESDRQTPRSEKTSGIKEIVSLDLSKRRSREKQKYHSKRSTQRVGRAKGSKGKQDDRVKVADYK